MRKFASHTFKRRLALMVAGMVLLPSVALAVVANVGGGTWNYGAEITTNGKHAWSHYQHQDKTHSSTAICGSQTKFSGRIPAGTWAYANAWGYVWSNSAAYWNTY